MRRILSLLALTVVAFASGCGDTTRPANQTAAVRDPRASISDGSFGGNPDFFFLPTLARDPKQNPNFDAGKFNANLAPVVTVCRLEATTLSEVQASSSCAANGTLVTFSGSRVRVFPSLEFYLAAWNLGSAPPDPHAFYRIQVYVGSVRLGFVDVSVVTSVREARNAITGEVIPLPADLILPIPFRIELGATGGCTNKGDCTEVTVKNTDGGTFFTTSHSAVIVLQPGFIPQSAIDAGVTSVTLSIDRRVVGPDNRCHTAPGVTGTLYGEIEGCYHYQTDPDLDQYGGLGSDATVAQCPEIPRTDANKNANYALYKSDPNQPLEKLPEAIEPAGLQCDGFVGSPTNIGLVRNPVLRFAAAGWHAFARGIERAVGVRPAYAWDDGLGGHLTAGALLSDIGWGDGLTASTPEGSDRLTGGFGLAAATPPTVLVVGDHNGMPRAGIPITFSARDGSNFGVDASGPIVTFAATTDANGMASVPQWILSETQSLNHVDVTGPLVSDAPLTFTAEGAPPNLVIESLTRSVASPTYQDQLSWTFSVKNIGAGLAEPTSAKLVITRLTGSSSTTAATFSFDVGRLQPGAEASFVTPALVAPLEPGSYSATATADVDQAIPLEPKDDNFRTQNFVVAGAFTGTWVGTISVTGLSQPVTLVVSSQDGTTATGQLLVATNENPVPYNQERDFTGVVNGDNLSFTISPFVAISGFAVSLTRSGNALTGTMTEQGGSGRTFAASLTRTSSATTLLARIPGPSLSRLPTNHAASTSETPSVPLAGSAAP